MADPAPFPVFFLAQSAPRPPRLTPGPTLLDTFFEEPLLTSGVALFMGVVLFFILYRLGKHHRALIAVVVAIAVAAALYIVAHVVETDREKVKARTRALVSAVERADLVTIEEMLAPSVAGVVYGTTRAPSRDALLRELDTALQQYRVASARVSTLEAASPIKGAAQTRARVVIRAPEATLYDIPNNVWFLIDWRIDDKGRWVATRIELEMIERRGRL